MKITQCNNILAYMRDVGPINPKIAEDQFGCMRLASRISDLRKRGKAIKKTMVDGKNKFGDDVRFAQYELLPEE